jgi:hypothetical protein
MNDRARDVARLRMAFRKFYEKPAVTMHVTLTSHRTADVVIDKGADSLMVRIPGGDVYPMIDRLDMLWDMVGATEGSINALPEMRMATEWVGRRAGRTARR